MWFVSGLLVASLFFGAAYSLWDLESRGYDGKTLAKLSYFFERIKEEDTNPMTDAEMQQFSTALRLDLQKHQRMPKMVVVRSGRNEFR